MTTIHAAAATHLHRRVTLAALAAMAGLVLAGCSSGTDVLGGNNQIATPAVASPPAVASSRIAIAPVIGAPDAVATQLSAQLTEAVEKQRVAVAKSPGDKADFTLRGYVVAAKEKAGTKLSYIWDVTDGAGKRVNRITGEETVEASAAKDPWASISPPVLQKVADKTAASLGAWLPGQAQAAVATSTPAGVGAQPQTAAVQPAQQPAAGRGQVASAPSGPTTGSIARDGALTAAVPSVTGAPGDGSAALTSAIQRELTKNGVTLADATAKDTYRVEGKVKVGEIKDGKQPVQIDWDVKDPLGKKVGTVSQKNEVPQGSLDGAWGKTADAAAAAAAQGILKLMPQPKATN